MSGPQIILWVIALAVLALCIRRGVPQAKRAVVETNRGFWRILPMFCVALPMAAFLSELVPADIATEWLGDDSGLSGILIASLAGGVMPGGPFVTFPLVLVLAGAGADKGALVAFILAWSLNGFQKLLVYEAPLLGLDFALLRTLITFPMPMIAGWIARRVPIAWEPPK